MKQYHDLLRLLLDTGAEKGDRTGTGTLSVFGHQMRFRLDAGLPLLTTKSVHWKSLVHELLWFISGSTNVAYLRENGVTIWDEWADVNGDLGPVYGRQWRSWPKGATAPVGCVLDRTPQETIDQLGMIVDEIKRFPDSRRLVVSAWNPSELDKMALAPCHCLFQFNTSKLKLARRMALYENRFEVMEWEDAVPGLQGMSPLEGKAAITSLLDEAKIPTRALDCQLYQRSADVFLGVPFNIASYALLTHLVAAECGLGVGDFVWTGGDVHLYSNHIAQAELLLSRQERPLPRIKLGPNWKGLFETKFEDIELIGYNPHPAIRAPVAV